MRLLTGNQNGNLLGANRIETMSTFLLVIYIDLSRGSMDE